MKKKNSNTVVSKSSRPNINLFSSERKNLEKSNERLKSENNSQTIKINGDKNVDYYYSSDDSDDEYFDLKNAVNIFRSIKKKLIALDESNESKNLENERNNTLKKIHELQEEQKSQEEPIINHIIEAQIYFSELFDLFENTPSDLSIVKPEFLDPEYAISIIRKFRKYNKQEYINSRMPVSIKEILENFAYIELRDFSFIQRVPLLDMKWVQCGWFLTDEDGCPDVIPKIFESFIPFFSERLQTTDFGCEEDYYVAYYHILHILEFCLYPNIAQQKLLRLFKIKLEFGFNSQIIDKAAYINICEECDIKASLR